MCGVSEGREDLNPYTQSRKLVRVSKVQKRKLCSATSLHTCASDSSAPRFGFPGLVYNVEEHCRMKYDILADVISPCQNTLHGYGSIALYCI